VHDVLVRDVAVGEDDLIDVTSAAQCFEPGFLDDRDALRIEPPRERRRIAPIVDTGDLGGGEGDDLDCRVVTIDGIEVMEVSSRGSQYDDASAPRAARLAGLRRRCDRFRARRIH
jgi:hypothetical protein